MRSKIALALMAILLAQGTDGVRLDAARRRKRGGGGGGKGFSSGLGAVGGILGGFGVPGADNITTASKTASGFEDAANGDTSVLNSITNASGLVASDIDSGVGETIIKNGETLDKVETAAVSGDQGQILEIVGQDVGQQVGDATGNLAIQNQIQDSSALTGQSVNTFVAADGNTVEVAKGLGTLTSAAGSGIGGSAGTTVTTASTGVEGVGTGIATGDAASATAALIEGTGDTLVLYDENAGAKVQDSAIVGEKLVIAGQAGDAAGVVGQLSNEAIILVDDQQTKDLIHEYDNDLQYGIQVGQEEGIGNAIVTTLDEANATTREIVLEQPATTATADQTQPAQNQVVTKAGGTQVAVQSQAGTTPVQNQVVTKADGTQVVVKSQADTTQVQKQVVTKADGTQVIVESQAPAPTPAPQVVKLSNGTTAIVQPSTEAVAPAATVQYAAQPQPAATAIVQPSAEAVATTVQVQQPAQPQPIVQTTQAITLADGTTAIVEQPAAQPQAAVPASNTMKVLQPAQIAPNQVAQPQVQGTIPAVTAQPTNVVMIP